MIVGIIIGYFKIELIIKFYIMKKKILFLMFFFLLFVNTIHSQTRTTVNASNSEISDNLDLKAVASIFGDSKNLEDFEYRLNNPKYKISNLDLNDDRQVDYLRVFETVKGNTHLIVIQAILEKDIFQDVATIEVEKDSYNNTQVQIVGDVYLYGNNYIFEPVYVNSPLVFSYFWAPNYRIYYSRWNWGYYPRFYNYWRPFPIYRYHRNVRNWINFKNQYKYVNVRRSSVAINLHRNIRANSYEIRRPELSFVRRNANVSNRYELDRTRNLNVNNRPVNNNVINNRNNVRNEAETRSTNSRIENSRRNQSESAVPQRQQNNDRTSRNTNTRERRNSNSRG
ncbi:MAG: hypothetical protein EBR38_05545 [Flavobacteriaceae bacterium]|nr:hypothetical protein [Flavobacteriaceae bacterium]